MSPSFVAHSLHVTRVSVAAAPWTFYLDASWENKREDGKVSRHHIVYCRDCHYRKNHTDVSLSLYSQLCVSSYPHLDQKWIVNHSWRRDQRPKEIRRWKWPSTTAASQHLRFPCGMMRSKRGLAPARSKLEFFDEGSWWMMIMIMIMIRMEEEGEEVVAY